MVLRKALNWSTSEIPIYNILRLEIFWIELFYSSITWWYCTGGNPNVGWEKLGTGLQLVLLDFVPPLVIFLVIISPIEVVQIVFILKFNLEKKTKNHISKSKWIIISVRYIYCFLSWSLITPKKLTAEIQITGITKFRYSRGSLEIPTCLRFRLIPILIFPKIRVILIGYINPLYQPREHPHFKDFFMYPYMKNDNPKAIFCFE